MQIVMQVKLTVSHISRKLVAVALLLLVLGAASRAQAAGIFCSEFSEGGVKGVVDGYDPATLAAVQSASTFGIDINCTVKNFPQSMGGFPITNINFNFPQQQSYYIAFENVYYYGNMSCNDPTQSDFWIYWAPGGYNNISPSCQAFMVPVDAVTKKNPTGQTTATIGVPFTYTITVPLLGKLDATGTFQYIANVDDANLTNVVIPDDLTTTGAAISYVSNTAYLVNPGTGARTPLNGGAPLTLGASSTWLASHPGILSDATKHLVFSYEYNAALASLPAGSNVEIDLTVVLDNNPTNLAGMQFTNTANMWFNKPINTTNMVDLEAQPGTTLPMAIVEPNLTLTKTGSATTINVDSQVKYTLNVQNTGGSDAWNTTITDNLPAGMSTYSPVPTVTAQIFASDGITPISAPLVNGTDFTLAWNGGSSSASQLTLTMLDTTKIAPTQRLIITYKAQLDSTGVASGTTFTNIAGATRWFSANSSYAGRREYDRTITDGTPGTLDFQDVYQVTAALSGYYFQKTVKDLTTGTYPAATAFPGDRLHYTLLLQNFTWPALNGITITDNLPLGLGSISNVTVTPAGGSTSVVQPSGGTTGSITITGLNLPGGATTTSQIQIDFDAALDANLTDGTIISNQANLTGIDSNGKTWSGPSDDPYTNGTVLLGSGGDPTLVTIQAPVALSKANTQNSATIGQQFSYLIKVPATPTNVPLYDVRILDNLGLSAANMTFVSSQVISGGSWNLTNTGTATNVIIQDLNTGIDIPAGGQAVIQVTVALQDTATNHNGVTFTNSASYTFNKINGDSLTQGTGGAATTSGMTVVEPHLTAAKTVSYASPAGKSITSPAAPGDVLRYAVTVKNDGSAEAYDADVMDFLPANVALVPGSATAQINGAAVSGFMTTPAVLASGALDWGNQNGDTSLDIPAGGTLVLTYNVSVLTTSGAPITNSVYVDWTSLSGAITGERTGAGCPNATSPNNYCTGPASAAVSSFDPTTLAKSVVSDSWTTTPSTGTDSTLRIGDTVVYSLALTLREGVTQNVVVTDTLPTGLAFDSVVGIAPASGSGNFTYTVASQPAPGATGTLTWNLGDITNAVDNNPANNTLLIQYRAHVVKNTLTQSPTAQQLTNNATLGYAINGVAATPKTTSATINVWQPLLNVSKSAATANGGTVITAGELTTYTVKIPNSGTAPAYNTVLADTLPVGMRQGGVTTTGITLVNTATNAVTATLPTLAPTYSAPTGVATWNFDVAGSPDLYAIPPGQTLQVVYQVKADAGLGAGMTLNNQAQVMTYYSFDSQDVPAGSQVTNRQVYGPTSTATVQLTTASATALSKQALVTTAAIGQPFTYSITVPAVPQATAMYDVRILDNLISSVTGVDMSFVSVQRVSGPTFTPVNTGTATNLVIQDTTSGIDIPAGQQVVVNVTVVLSNAAINTLGKQFQNTATYTYDSVNNTASTQENGAPGASPAITIVGPNLTMQKSGPGTINALSPGTFTLNVQNTGGSTAWQTTLTDILPNVTTPPTGSMCGTAPANVTARIYQADGVTPVSAALSSGTDFTVGFAGAPACTFTVSMKSSAAAIPPMDRLIVTYSAALDPNTAGGITLTNVAGATQWLSADPAATLPANIQTSTFPLTNGTPSVLDNQDAFTVTTQAPLLTFAKTVQNVTTGQSGANAKPGDTLQYTLKIQNVGTLGASNFTLTDDLDKLNTPAMFATGSLKLIAVPAGANTSLTSATGGTKGTGLVSIAGLSVAPQGQTGDTLVIQFQVTLAPVINSGTLVLNQAQIGSPLLPTQLSDDPSVTGTADPTRTLITSAPFFQVLKTVQDITSGSATVMAGDTLRYTITVKNDGTENATGVTLRDLIPANTTYVAKSTTLNGAAVADPSAGVSALQNGMLINSPANPTAGAMPANAGTTTANVATVTFQVQISKNVVAGTLISNQAFVDGSGATSGPFPEQPSDNPATPVPNDPTTVVVGNLPLVYALKTVQLAGDVNGNGLVDPGDTLQYTITVTNSGATPATGLVLTDAIPANTTYVANSVQMNGAAVADPTPGVSPLTNGMGVSGGTLSASGTGVVTFKVQVNPGVATGTIISNQGSVATAQLPTLLTDSDGNPTNGYQPTVITVGNAQQLSITKSAAVVGGGAALPGSVLEYTIQATNVGQVPATNVVITDDLTPLLAQAAYVANSATMNGSANGVSFTTPVIAANYGATYGTLSPGGAVVVRFRVTLNSTAAAGSVVANTAQASWNTPTQTASGSTSVAIGGMPGSGSLNGLVWHDANFNNTLDSGEQTLVNWAVDLYENGRLLSTVYTVADGSYHFSGVTPNAGTSIQYELRFRAPGAGARTAMLGWCSSPFTNGMQRISNIVVGAGGVLQDLNLPATPNGVVYNSIVGTPIAGATLTMVQASSKMPLAGSCFNDPAQQGQVTPSGGYYKFDLNFSDPTCPSGGDYLIQVTPPPSGYMAGVSKLVPPTSSSATASFSVPACPGSSADAVPGTPNYCEAQASDLAPAASVLQAAAASRPVGAGAAYYLHLTLDNVQPGYSQIYNNHIAIDPTLNTAIAITKTAALVNVTRGQLVPYTITLNNTLGVALQNLSVVDTFPLGFKYVAGSARMDGQKIEPAMNTRQLIWSIAQLASSTTHTITFLMIVGSGVSEGEYVNRAQVMDNAVGSVASGVASATVQVIADPDFDCTDIIGKVFDDANANGYPDAGEKGLPGVRAVTANGLIATTDEYGRFHIDCATVPDEDRGSNFILKLDDRTLPTGYRVTSENPQVQRATRGKMLRFNFGATIHHVVSLDVADGVFEPKSTKLRMQWEPRIGLLLKELRKAPSVLRLSYLGDVEHRGLVEDRLKALKKEITGKWDGGYPLTIETEVFWRRGGPP
ncbi:MAG TPA: isopeptide-forming domain-containing fimbrial protein [Geobacteraceae bacterium]